MPLFESVAALRSSLGSAAKFAATQVLNVCLPGSAAVVELVGKAFDAPGDVLKNATDAAKDVALARRLNATDDEVARLADILDVVRTQTGDMLARVAKLEATPAAAEELLAKSLAESAAFRQAAAALQQLAARVDRIETRLDELTAGQAELRPLFELALGASAFADELATAGLTPTLVRDLRKYREAVGLLVGGRPDEAERAFADLAAARTDSAAAVVGVAAAQAAGGRYADAGESLTKAKRRRPKNAALNALHSQVTVALTHGHTPVDRTRLGLRQPKPGDTLDGWKLDRLLGRGGMGQVFRAASGGKIRAVKVMNPELSRDKQFEDVFKDEMTTLMVLKKHPHASRVSIETFGFCRDFGCWYFVMPFYDGPTLEQHLQDHGPLRPDTARKLFAGLAEGLGAAHGLGVFHRDIKPRNVIVTAGGVAVLVDFGIAGLEGVTGHTKAAGYDQMFASPEQVRSGKADARSDVYSLAATLYYALKYDDATLRDPLKFKPRHAPELFRDLLTQAFDNDADERPANGKAFLAALPEVPTIVVCAAGTGQFKEVADAVKAAKPGTLIKVRPGVYRKGVVLDKNVDIVADGPREDVVIETADASCVTMKTAEASVRGFTLRLKVGDNGRKLYGVDIPEGRLLLDGCDITSDSYACVAVHGPKADPVVRDCIIRDGKASGVFVYESGAGTFEGCHIHGNTNTGVAVKTQGNPVVRDCLIRDGKKAGVFVCESGAGTFEGCHIHGNAIAGVVVTTQGNPVVRDCVIRDGEQGGVFVCESGAGTFEGCHIYGNAFSGVEVKTQGNPVVRDCLIRDGKKAGVFVCESGAGTFEGCHIHGNATRGVGIQEQGNPTLRNCKINRNKGHGVRSHTDGRGVVEGCDLSGNEKGPWSIEDTSKVERRNNTE